ncbi:hypothetical protein Avbf_09343 [Armadillidium vulgare]|nr:hypothetical protein Avbf_09343 [Armadillidium vulgare]
MSLNSIPNVTRFIENSRLLLTSMNLLSLPHLWGHDPHFKKLSPARRLPSSSCLMRIVLKYNQYSTCPDYSFKLRVLFCKSVGL